MLKGTQLKESWERLGGRGKDEEPWVRQAVAWSPRGAEPFGPKGLSTNTRYSLTRIRRYVLLGSISRCFGLVDRW